MSNRRFFTLMIIGTILLLLILLPQDQLVGAEKPLNEEAPGSLTDNALSALTNLQSDSKSVDGQKNLENKIQALEYRQQVQYEANQQPQKSLEEICRSVEVQNLSSVKQADVQEPGGILELEEDFLGDRGYLTTNMWRGEFNGYKTEVYVGSLLSNPDQGILMMNIPILDFLKVFSDPNPSGALTITAVNGDQLQFTSTNGSLVNFSLPAQQFTSDLSKSMAVADLPPLPTPIADPCAAFDSP